jgi:UDP-3-O-[3-hydroxymyristoyl] glucosamine N-acyltransferase
MVKKISLDSIIKILGVDRVEVKGKKNNFFSKFSAIDEADKDSICFCKYKDERAPGLLTKTKASIVLCHFGISLPERADITYILVENPRLCFAKLLSKYHEQTPEFKIHQTAIIGKNCKIGRVSIRPYVFIGNNVKIGDNSIIFPHAVISNNVTIGKNVIIKSNATIGQKGFGFEFNKNHIPISIPHIGGVKIGNNVEIGANSTVCCGTLSDTIISDFVKIDDNVFIAHNVKIGERTMITACAEISGSVTIGSDCWLGPNCSIMNHISIGNEVLIGLGAVVINSLPDRVVVAGNPAKIIRKRERGFEPWKGISR